jgi:hypothetical protein
LPVIHPGWPGGPTSGPPGPGSGKPGTPDEVILMRDSQHFRRLSPAVTGAARWRATRRAVRALRIVNDQQVLMWELFWQAGRIPVERTGRAGPLAWAPSLDGPRLTGSNLPTPDEASAGDEP